MNANSPNNSNRGLIGAATMLGVVSMLNYIGNEASSLPSQVCTSLDEEYTQEDGLQVL